MQEKCKKFTKIIWIFQKKKLSLYCNLEINCYRNIKKYKVYERKDLQKNR